MPIPFLGPIGIILFSVYMIILFIGAIALFRRAAKTESDLKQIKVYNVSLGLFILFLGLAYLIRTYFMFFIANDDIELLNQLTATERTLEALPDYIDGRLGILQVSWQWHMAVIFLGIAFLVFATEYLMFRKTKFLITIISFATIPLVVAFPYDIAHDIYFGMYISPVLWLFVYIQVARQSTGSVRKNAIMLVVGVAIFIVGVFMNSSTVRGWFFPEVDFHVNELGAVFSAWIAPIVLIIGSIVTISAIFNKF
ncbi:MAG: hypothetical protein ACFFCS_17855 [Candidatus Hodarchaeota archaeon]